MRARRESYIVTAGSITFDGKNLLEMKAEDAACEGLFMAFQYPVEIPGISNAYFLRAALNAILKYRGQDEMDAIDFLPLLKEKMRMLEMDERFLREHAARCRSLAARADAVTETRLIALAERYEQMLRHEAHQADEEHHLAQSSLSEQKVRHPF